MKKFLITIILLISVSLTSFGQYLEKDYSRIANLSVYIMDGDTSYTMDISDGTYTLDSQFIWTGLDALDATIQVQTSTLLTGENFVDYTPLKPVELNTADNSGKIMNSNYPLSTKRVRWNVDAGACTAGELLVYIHVIRFR